MEREYTHVYRGHEPKRISQEKRDKLAKRFGEVYAINTSKGYALGQIVDIEDRNGIYLCRIFNKLYKEVPENVGEIIAGKEDYTVRVMLNLMAHPRAGGMARKLGKYEVPGWYSKPKFVRGSTAFGGDGSHAPWIYWYVVYDYLPSGELTQRDEWVIKVLGKDMYDESWKEDFRRLSPHGYWNGQLLLDRIEAGWNLEKWVPIDFHMDLEYLWKEYFKTGIKPYLGGKV